MTATLLTILLISLYSCSLITALDNCVPRDCLDQLKQSQLQRKCACSGVYTIKPDDLPPFKVYCDMETDGGGWTVFQRRMDGSEDFYRIWKDYSLGFGDLEGEFWLGLDKINRLTKTRGNLRIDLEDFSNNKRYAKYSSFSVGNAVTQYKMTVSGYSGNAGNSFTYHNGMKFSTKDRDNDKSSSKGSSEHCAVRYKGGWWYNHCHQSNLNGRYLFGPHKSYADGVEWYHFKGHHYSLKFTEMKLRH